MNKDIYELIDIINHKGYNAYVVGGFVRDYIWGLENRDVDIVTNAPSKLILDIFSLYKPHIFKNETIKFNYGEYTVDIAHLRKEEFADGKTTITFTDELKEDYLRRDLTFNAIYMDKDGRLYEFGTSLIDCNERKLKFINNAASKCKEDPTRFLRAIYYILKYDLKDYRDLDEVVLNQLDFDSCDVNALNKVIYKILKLGDNKRFVNLLVKYNIYDFLFKNKTLNYDVKPLDFLRNNEYIFIDSI